MRVGTRVTGTYADVRAVAGASAGEIRCRVREVRVTGTIIFVNEARGTAIVAFERPVRPGVRGSIFELHELEAA